MLPTPAQSFHAALCYKDVPLQTTKDIENYTKDTVDIDIHTSGEMEAG